MADSERKQKTIGIQEAARELLVKLSEKHRVSMQGLVTALVFMADGQHPDFGIIDIDWKALKRKYPNQEKKRRQSWDAVLLAVEAMMEETDDPAQMAQRSRFTINQCARAMRELKGENTNTPRPRRVRKDSAV